MPENSTRRPGAATSGMVRCLAACRSAGVGRDGRAAELTRAILARPPAHLNDCAGRTYALDAAMVVDADLVTGLCGHDAVSLAGMLRRREVSAREVAAAHIARTEALDGAVNALVTRSFEAALASAARADEAMSRGEPAGLLHGLPVAR